MADEILTKDGLLAELNTMKSDLEKSLLATAKAETETSIKAATAAVELKIKEVKGLDGITNEELIKMKADMVKTIADFDLFQTKMNDKPLGGAKKVKYLDEAIGEQMANEDVLKDLEKALKSSNGSFVLKLEGPVSMQRKTDMLTSNFFTGDPVATYNPRQAIIPGQKVNYRDLIPTSMSKTGLYVTYKEDTGETNNIAMQTEGAAKAVNNYAMTEVKTVNKYLAGTEVFSKQLLKSADWMQNTLTRLLLRDFYKKENAYFNTSVNNAATGTQSSGTSPDDIKQLIAQIGAILDTDYNASVVLVKNALLARMIQSTYTNGYYPGAGMVTLAGEGLRIWNVPVVGASWQTANKATIFDADYLERVEVEGLNLAFSFEDGNNFSKNLVTARVECFEEINLMRTESAFYIDLGNS